MSLWSRFEIGRFSRALAPLALLAGFTASTNVLAQPSEAMIKAAKSEGEITVYIALADEVAAPWFKDFESKYGIQIQTYRANSATVARRLVMESDARKSVADAIILTEFTSWRDLDSKKVIAEYTPASAKDFDPAQTLPGKFYPLYFFSYALAWNTGKVSAEEAKAIAEKGFDELLNPRWAGRIGMSIPQSAIYPEYYRITQKRGFGYWEALAKNKPKLYESVSPLQSQLVQGEIAVALSANSGSISNYAVRGAPIQFSFPDGDTGTSPFGVGLVANAPHSNAAKLFVEWATSADAQSKLSQLANSAPANKTAKNLAAIDKMTWYKPPASLYLDGSKPEVQAAEPEFVSRWNKTFNYAR